MSKQTTMTGSSMWILIAAAAVTLITLSVWVVTGRHAYTKFEVVETVEVAAADDDLFAGTGLYDGESQQQTVRRDEFHLGLIPTPTGPLDRHMLSVSSILALIWIPALSVVWRSWRRLRSTVVSGRSAKSPA